MIMAQCLFIALKRQEPDRPIDVMAPQWAAVLLARMPEVRTHIDAPFRRGRLELRARWNAGRALRGRYDQAYVLQGNWKSALLPWFAGIARRIGYVKEFRYGLLNDIRPLSDSLKRKTAQAFQQLVDDGPLPLPALAIDNDLQQALLRRFGLTRGNFVALAPGAEYGPAKRWPSTHYAALARELSKRGLACVIFGGGGDELVGEEIRALAPEVLNLCGKTQLEEAVDLIAAARFAVSNDSGLMHVAAATGTPVVAVYGSTSTENTPPLSQRCAVVSLRLSCSPCHERVCPLGHLNCLAKLEVGQVVAAAESLDVL
jgi:heptosyltransferase-2